MVAKKKEVSLGKILAWLSFIEAGCALLFSPVVFALRGVILGILAARCGEKKLGMWGVVSNLVGAAVGIAISLQYSAMMG